MTATGLSADPEQYRTRLEEQPDESIDAWVAELMRDISIRRGVEGVLRDFMLAAELTEPQLERVYAAGGGPPATLGRTGDGRLMVPAIALHHLVSGLRREAPGARHQLVRYLAENFHEIVYI
ncbi:hypothetical protein BH20CHL6_BH20CHL6_07930 [soil metagenome]